MNEETCRFNVYIRLRPPIDCDSGQILDDLNSFIILDKKHQKLILQSKKGEDKSYSFDFIFSDSSAQPKVYEIVGKPIINSVLQGLNGTIIAYGQTGSGKTYTVFGTKKSLEETSNDFIPYDSGLVFRSLKTMFQHIYDNSENKQFQVTVAFMEIYMENIKDLLSDSPKKTFIKDIPLQIREDPKTGIYVEGLTQIAVRNLTEVISLIKEGVRNRMTSTTTMNKNSSRSHAILQIFLEQRWIEIDEANPKLKRKIYKKSLLSIVDLAGSERLSKSCSEGIRMEEAKNINLSISALGNCIAALSNESKKFKFNNYSLNHVPFRNSKLTRLLSESLSGHSKTNIIACISDNLNNYEETYSTLNFASRSMKISVRATINENIHLKVLKDISNKGNESSEESDVINENEINIFKNGSNPSSINGSNKEFSDKYLFNMDNNKTNEKKKNEKFDYEKPFIFNETPKPLDFKNSIQNTGKNEREIILKFSKLLEHFQQELIKKDFMINNLQNTIEEYELKFGKL